MSKIPNFDSEEKQKYREVVWGQMFKLRSPAPDDNFLILAGEKTQEAPLLIYQYGIDPHRIYAVDEEASFVELAEVVYGVNPCAGKISKIVKHLAKQKIKIHYANLDFCGTAAGRETREELSAFAKSEIVAEGGLIAVNTQKATRASGALDTHTREGWILKSLRACKSMYPVMPVAMREYQGGNGNVTYRWGIFRMQSISKERAKGSLNIQANYHQKGSSVDAAHWAYIRNLQV